MNISAGSLEECRYCLLLAKDLSYAEDPSLAVRAEEVARLLASYTRALANPR
jgi:four helix bundle protein